MLLTVSRSAAWLIATSLLLAAGVTFFFSLNHPISADLAMLHYSAWVINEKNFVLYRDIFDINFPAPYLFHSLLGKLIGYEAAPLRWVDFVLMSTLGWASWRIISPFSKPAAVTGFSLFCLLYWAQGGEFALERDVLALVPAVIAFALASNKKTSLLICVLIGCFAALACSMKPNSVVIVPVLLWMLYRSNSITMNKKTSTLVVCLCSMASVSLIPFIWVIANNGLRSFFDIYQHYMPIYANSRYDLWHYENSTERWMTLLTQYLRFAGISLLLSLPGLVWAWLQNTQNTEARQHILQLAAMTFSFTFYEAIAGKFWFNHMFPSAYWSFLCLSLLLITPSTNAAAWKKYLAIIFLVPCAALGWLLSKTTVPTMQQAHIKEQQTPNSWRAKQVANFLLTHPIKPEETVQVLDMAGDGQAALLMARATSATKFLIDVPLWMEPDSESIKKLRAEFVAELQQKNPTYIVYFEQFLHPGGGNRLKEFKPLYQWITQNYAIVEQREAAYIIFQRKADQ